MQVLGPPHSHLELVGASMSLSRSFSLYLFLLSSFYKSSASVREPVLAIVMVVVVVVVVVAVI